MRRRPETAIRLGIKRLLRQVGFSVWDMEQNRPTRQTPGLPDLIALGHSWCLMIECKTPKGRLTDYQRGFQKACEGTPADYIVIRGVDEMWDWLVAHGVITEAE